MEVGEVKTVAEISAMEQVRPNDRPFRAQIML